MKYLSVCSGIEAATVAWHGIGWKPLAFSEIEAFPRAVLQHHYPDVPLYGDFTTLKNESFIVDADVLVGGTPCQAFSVAGLRQSLDDHRGNLTLEFVRLADAIDFDRDLDGREPAIIVWENVPGVLNTKDNAFGCFLAGLAGEGDQLQPPGGKWRNAGLVYGAKRAIAWRVLDAQYFGLAQRRRRVFVVASARNGFDPATFLFEPEGLRRDTPPSREARESVAPTISARTKGGGGLGTDFDLDGGLISVPDISPAMKARDSKGPSSDGDGDGLPLVAVAHILKGEGFDGSEDGTGRGTPLVFQPRFARNGRGAPDEIAGPLTAQAGETGKGDSAQCVAYPEVYAFNGDQSEKTRSMGEREGQAPTLREGGPVHVAGPATAVRRLTPTECERLQGFPDGYTDIKPKGKPTADGPRYKALGNSMAVPVMRWIGWRIAGEGLL